MRGRPFPAHLDWMERFLKVTLSVGLNQRKRPSRLGARVSQELPEAPVLCLHLREAPLAEGLCWSFLQARWEPGGLLIKASSCQHVRTPSHFDGANRLISAQCCKRVLFNSCFPFLLLFQACQQPRGSLPSLSTSLSSSASEMPRRTTRSA